MLGYLSEKRSLLSQAVEEDTDRILLAPTPTVTPIFPFTLPKLSSFMNFDNNTLNDWLKNNHKKVYEEILNYKSASLGLTNEENPVFRDIKYIIEEGIQEFYATHKDKRVYYQTERRDFKDFKEGIEKGNFEKMFTVKELNSILFSAAWQIDYLDYVIPGSGLFDDVQRRLSISPGFQNIDLKKYIFISEIRDDKNLAPEVRKDVALWVQDLKSFIESEYTIQNGPISASKLISYFLDKNNGNLQASLWDTTILLKILARGASVPLHSYTLDFSGYYALRIKDEFNRTNNFNSLKNILDLNFPKDAVKYDLKDQNFSLVNQVGTPYNKMNIVSLLGVIPPEVIKIFVIIDRHVLGFSTEGGIKTEAGYDTALSLDDLDRYFYRFPREP